MSAKQVHLFNIGAGDPYLQSLIEQGLAALDTPCTVTEVEGTQAQRLLDTLAPGRLPILLKPPL